MCGIFALLFNNGYGEGKLPQGITPKQIETAFMESRHRGPDVSKVEWIENVFFGFHRLKIVDLSDAGNQPFDTEATSWICNGEIYNHEKLRDQYALQCKGHSDCEVIGRMYELLLPQSDLRTTLGKLFSSFDGVFAASIYDKKNRRFIVGRDPLGVRALYMAKAEWGWGISSEMKSLIDLGFEKIIPFPNGTYRVLSWKESTHSWEFDFEEQYYSFEYPPRIPVGTTLSTEALASLESEALIKIRELLTEGTRKRLMSDRPIGCLLSGGIDSSLIASLVVRLTKETTKKKLLTFSIGMEGSTDLFYARKVADFLGTDHHEFIVQPEEMLNAIPSVIRQIESYDTTSVRASTPMYLLSKYIKEKTDVVVIYSGEGSDEASGSYLYFHHAPSSAEFRDETVRLLKELHYFDNLRADKSSAGWGLEIRVPFLDKAFLQYYMSLPPELKQPRDGAEKWLLRKAFDDGTYLPKEVLWRKKEAFSDGVSSQKKSWFQLIQEKVHNEHPDPKSLDTAHEKYPINPPHLLESLWYREVFEKNFASQGHVIPHYWLPKWVGDVKDPSARVLKVYEETEEVHDF